MQLAKRLWQVSMTLVRFLLSGEREGQDLPLLCFAYSRLWAVLPLSRGSCHDFKRSKVLSDGEQFCTLSVWWTFSLVCECRFTETSVVPERILRAEWADCQFNQKVEGLLLTVCFLKEEEAFQMNRNAALLSQGHISCSTSQTWVSSLTYIKHGVLRSWPFIWVLLFSVVQSMWTYCQSLSCLSSHVFYTTIRISICLEP